MIPFPFQNSDQSVWFRNPATGFVPWMVPQNARELLIFAQGGTGGGGNGFSGIAGSARGGGGSGGSGAKMVIRAPVALLPPVLYVRVGLGGLPGINGGETRVATRPLVTALHALAIANGAAFGGNGTSTAAGTAGAGGTATSITQISVAQVCPAPLLVGGMAGVAGGVQTGAVGPSITWGSGNALLTSGGAGGAGTTSADFAGGSVINGVDGYAATSAGGAAGSFDGAHGPYGWTPPWSHGGAGGGSSNTGPGGRGGDGGPGSGGGGGGAGTTGGTGGRGGDGFVWILPLF